MGRDFIITEPAANGLQRLAARFHGHAYDPHRHETYAVGATLSGAQAFRYRGAGRVSRSGQCMVLHPDEPHDGHAVAEDGFLYRMAYVDPALVRAALDMRGDLPFAREPVQEHAALANLIDEAFADFPGPLDALAADAFVAGFASLLAGQRDDADARSARALPLRHMERVKALLDDGYRQPIGSADLERVSGLDRFETARLFRRLNGTSPHRYLTGRRLAAAHRLIAGGEALSEVAAAVGFADQSHMTRAFKARYGMTPGRFRSLVAAGIA